MCVGYLHGVLCDSLARTGRDRGNGDARVRRVRVEHDVFTRDRRDGGTAARARGRTALRCCYCCVRVLAREERFGKCDRPTVDLCDPSRDARECRERTRERTENRRGYNNIARRFPERTGLCVRSYYCTAAAAVAAATKLQLSRALRRARFIIVVHTMNDL